MTKNRQPDNVDTMETHPKAHYPDTTGATPYGTLAAQLGESVAKQAMDALELAARRGSALQHRAIIVFDQPGGSFGSVLAEPTVDANNAGPGSGRGEAKPTAAEDGDA